jgi:hypothetical protein
MTRSQCVRESLSTGDFVDSLLRRDPSAGAAPVASAAAPTGDLLVLVLADLVADEATDRGTTHHTNPATSGEDRTADGTGSSADGRVLLLAGHARTGSKAK